MSQPPRSYIHFDHTGNANSFTDSTLLIQREDHDIAFGPDPTATPFVDPSTYDQLDHGRTQILNGEHDVFGDGSVLMIPTPGHTPGHQVLLVDLPETGPVVLSGDLYHSALAFENDIVPAPNTDAEATRASFEKVKKLLEEKGATLWIQHDKEQNATIPHAPDFVS